MVVEIFSICDAATDYSGRLNILGAFEGIAAITAPIARDRCSLAVRIRFQVEETGAHVMDVRFVDPAGALIAPKMEATFDVKIGAGRMSGAHNLVLNINRLLFPVFGNYEIQLWVDGEQRSSLPLLVTQTQRRNRLRSSMEN